MDLGDIVENIKQGREAALLGNYDSATVYYQSVITQISKHLKDLSSDPSKRVAWQKVGLSQTNTRLWYSLYEYITSICDSDAIWCKGPHASTISLRYSKSKSKYRQTWSRLCTWIAKCSNIHISADWLSLLRQYKRTEAFDHNVLNCLARLHIFLDIVCWHCRSSDRLSPYPIYRQEMRFVQNMNRLKISCLHWVVWSWTLVPPLEVWEMTTWGSLTAIKDTRNLHETRTSGLHPHLSRESEYSW